MNTDILGKRNESFSRAVIALNNFNVKAFLTEVFTLYKWYLQNYPIYTKGITSCVIAMIGEVIAANVKAQIRKEKVNVDLKRVLTFGLYGKEYIVSSNSK